MSFRVYPGLGPGLLTDTKVSYREKERFLKKADGFLIWTKRKGYPARLSR